MDANLLTEFGITKTEAKIYETILKFNETTIGPIIKITNLHRGTVYNSINSLIKKGFLCFIDKEGSRYYKTTGEKIFETLLQERKKDVTKKEKAIKDLFENLNKFKQDIGEQNIDVFHGLESFKTLFLEIFDFCKKNNCEYLFQGKGGEMQDATGKGFYIYTQKLKKKMKINCRVILNKESINHPYHKHVVGNIRYLSKGIHSPVNFWIYENTVLLVLFSSKPLTTIKIKSKVLADSFRDYFEFLWKISKNEEIILTTSFEENILEYNEKEFYKELNFNNLKSRRDFQKNFENNVIPKLKNKVVMIILPHSYSVNENFIRERMALFNKYKIKFYRICKGHSLIDKFITTLYQSLGGQAKMGIDYGDDSWIVIYGDYILQTKYDKKIKDMEKKCFSLQNELDKKYFKVFQDFYYKKGKVKVILQKNKYLAKILKEKMLIYFK